MLVKSTVVTRNIEFGKTSCNIGNVLGYHHATSACWQVQVSIEMYTACNFAGYVFIMPLSESKRYFSGKYSSKIQ